MMPNADATAKKVTNDRPCGFTKNQNEMFIEIRCKRINGFVTIK